MIDWESRRGKCVAETIVLPDKWREMSMGELSTALDDRYSMDELCKAIMLAD